MLNSWVGIGRLTADPTLRYTPNGVANATFTLAVDRKFAKEGQQKTDFIQIVTWSKLAENCANYLTKGKMAAATGEIHIRSYDGQDGQKKWVTEVVADNVRFLSPKDSGGNSLGNEVDMSSDFPF